MKTEKVVYDFGHLYKGTAYESETIADGVLKLLDKLQAIYQLALDKIGKIDRTRELTATGKQKRYRELGAEFATKLAELDQAVTGYWNHAQQLRDQMAPKRHDRNDLAWHLELREVRDHINGLDKIEREQFVMAAIERGNERVLEAIEFAPIPFSFVTQPLLEKMIFARACAQHPEIATKLRDVERAESEARSALASVRAGLLRQGLKTGTDAVTQAAAA